MPVTENTPEFWVWGEGASLNSVLLYSLSVWNVLPEGRREGWEAGGEEATHLPFPALASSLVTPYSPLPPTTSLADCKGTRGCGGPGWAFSAFNVRIIS